MVSSVDVEEDSENHCLGKGRMSERKNQMFSTFPLTCLFSVTGYVEGRSNMKSCRSQDILKRYRPHVAFLKVVFLNTGIGSQQQKGTLEQLVRWESSRED